MSNFGLILVASVCLVAGLGANQKDKKDDVIGAIWEYKIERDGKTEHGTFRVFQYDIFKGAHKVGKVQPKNKEESTLNFNGLNELAGTAIIRKVRRKPPVWKGTLKKADGTEWDIRIDVRDK